VTNKETNEERYIKYKLEGLLDCKKKYKEKHENYNNKEVLYKDFQKRFNISHDEYNNYVKKFADIQGIKAKYTKEREDGFKSIIKFYDWYKSQEKKCGYCGTSENTLKKIFESKKLTSKKFTATLHIERKNPNGEYNEENCMLACSLCNNAKSDLINEENYRKYFEKSMNKFLKDLNNDLIKNS
jgi:5-methylcytosine-specific restriction endonuclease McrA